MFYIAHVKWFVTNNVPVVPHLSLLEWIVVALIVVFGVFVALFVEKLFRGLNEKIDNSTKTFVKYIPTIVRVVAGSGLLVACYQDQLIAVNIHWHSELVMTVLLIIGLSWVFGLLTRFTALAMIILYGLLLFKLPLDDVLEHLEYLAAAILLIVSGSGEYSLDSLLKLWHKPYDSLKNRTYLLYQQLIGFSLVLLALDEKLLHPELSYAFLQTHNWNFLSVLGAPNRLFIVVMGAMELLFGLLLILNIVPRLVVLAILLTMITTACLLGITEVYGHLFAVGLVSVIWIGNYYQKPIIFSNAFISRKSQK